MLTYSNSSSLWIESPFYSYSKIIELSYNEVSLCEIIDTCNRIDLLPSYFSLKSFSISSSSFTILELRRNSGEKISLDSSNFYLKVMGVTSSSSLKMYFVSFCAELLLLVLSKRDFWTILLSILNLMSTSSISPLYSLCYFDED